MSDMKTLIVDFNMREADGLVPALLVAGDAEQLFPGARVFAADGEGTECRAVVVEVAEDGSHALLAPVSGTWNRDSQIGPPATDLFAAS